MISPLYDKFFVLFFLDIQTDQLHIGVEGDAEIDALFLVLSPDDRDGVRLVGVRHAGDHRVRHLLRLSEAVGRRVHHVLQGRSGRRIAHIAAQFLVDLVVFTADQLVHHAESGAEDRVLLHSLWQGISLYRARGTEEQERQCRKRQSYFLFRFLHLYIP